PVVSKSLTRSASAKLNDVEPLAYLTDILQRIVSGQTKVTDLDSLLPWNWKRSRQSTDHIAQAAA
ncbi:transposase IS66, partial [mine drainage metagenome]